MTRQQKTPRQRAEEALAVEERRVRKLDTKAKALRAELDAVERAQRAATARRDYLEKHPDLQQPTTAGTADRSTTR